MILAVLAAIVVPLATSLMDGQRAYTAEDDLAKIYTAIVGNPAQNTYGYLGDVGCYPASILDLVQQPGSFPAGCTSAGWNGPYLSNPRIDTGVIYDSFGGPIEYFSANPAVFPAAAADQLALISRGPDRGSTNPATANSGNGNPNVAGSFTGVLPSSASYSAGSGNADNVVYPHFADNTSLVNYQSLGKLNVNISNYDDGSGAVMPACPNYYDLTITSVPRGTVEAWVNYTAGGASFDLLQGLYLVKVFVAGAGTPTWQEQVAIVPGTLTTRNITLSGINSSLAGTSTVNIYNTTGATVTIYAGSSSKGTAATGAVPPTSTFTINRCMRVLIVNSSNVVIDSFIEPATSATNRRYPAAAACTAGTYSATTFANQTYNTVAIYDDGLLVGTVGKRGNKRQKSITGIRVGDVLTFKDQTNTAATSNPVGPYTVPSGACTVVQF